MNNASRLQPIEHFFKSNPGESIPDFLHRAPAEMILIYNEIGPLEIDKAEYKRLPDKQIESQINNEILNKCCIEKVGKISERRYLSTYIKAAQMKTSSLSSAVIEAALTIIIHRMNDENATDNDQYAVIKQLPFKISYIDDHKSQMKGVRVFEAKTKNPPEDNKIIVLVN